MGLRPGFVDGNKHEPCRGGLTTLPPQVWSAHTGLGFLLSLILGALPQAMMGRSFGAPMTVD